MLYEKKRPGRLQHGLPHWVDPWGAVFHIRLRTNPSSCLTEPSLAPRILDSVVLYALRHRWWPHLFLLMPDHLHALLSFPPEGGMSAIIGQWKRWHARTNHVEWQEGYFDHRLRREESFDEKARYIRRNPVVRGLCVAAEDWPWVVTADQVRAAFEAESREESKATGASGTSPHAEG